MSDMLLFSNSTNSGSSFLGHAQDAVASFLDGVNEVLFIPYALADHDAYTDKVAIALAVHGVRTVGIHTTSNQQAAAGSAQVIFVGGGNTFRLVSQLQRRGLDKVIQAAVTAGTKYMGASAGTNIAAPTIRTTNDMPIVQPKSFEALGLVPFQINPHFLDANPASGHAGESREDRIREFLEENEVAVLGLREGTHLRVSGHAGAANFVAAVRGQAVDSAKAPAVIFQRGALPVQVSGDVSSLFTNDYRFDLRAQQDS